MEVLYRHEFWHLENGRNIPGLAAVMNERDRIGEITADYVEIVKPSGNRQRFYHPYRNHPWAWVRNQKKTRGRKRAGGS